MGKASRRTFLKFATGGAITGGIAAVFGPLLAYFYPPELVEVPAEPVLVGPEQELPVGASKTVRFGRYPALVIHTQQGLRAYSAVCTHFACICKWDAEKDEIVCPCHEGYFSPYDGSVLAGPPPTPLATLKVENRAGQIYVGGES